MYYVYSDERIISETPDFDTACDTAMLFGGMVVDSCTGEILLEDNSDLDISFDSADIEMGFNPYCGCYDFDC